MENLITLRAFLEKRQFLIPQYQRGYIWGKSRETDKDSVTYLLENILSHYKDSKSTLFLQGITFCKRGEFTELIDGQQRMTFFYLLLIYLKAHTLVKEFEYSIREDSLSFLSSIKDISIEELLDVCKKDEDEDFQDIYYFKKTIRIIDQSLKGYSSDQTNDFIKYILDQVNFLYINIPQDKATLVFKMMNGNKAEMRVEEIIKAEMLRLVSLEKDIQGKENKEKEAERWEQNSLRSRYAREWDRWLYWWNRDEVQEYFGTKNVMGLLLQSYFTHECKCKGKGKVFNFENFKKNLLSGEKISAKNVFYALRQLQHRFEMVYNSISDDFRYHNKIRVIFELFNNIEKSKFIQTFFVENNNIDIDEFVKYVYLGLTHNKILSIIDGEATTELHDELDAKKDELIHSLDNNNLYYEKYDIAYWQLLRRNIEQDTKLKRKFDFKICKDHSLEHIYPKSKAFHKDKDSIKDVYLNGSDEPVADTKGMLNRADFNGEASEHCIGNLVLLYGNENSKFSNATFETKKGLYFDVDAELKSRHLLHSISVFASKIWGVDEIKNNKNKFITEVKKYYGIQ